MGFISDMHVRSHKKRKRWKIRNSSQENEAQSLEQVVSGKLDLLLFSHKSCPTLCDPQRLQHTRPPYLLRSPRVSPNSRPLSRWCHPTISSSVVPFSCLQSFPASGSFPVSQFFASSGQSIRVSSSILPVNIQDLFPLGFTGLISLLSKKLSRVFSPTPLF